MTTRPATPAAITCSSASPSTAPPGGCQARRWTGTATPDIAKRTAIFHQMTVDATSNLELFYIAMPGRPGDAGRMAGQGWLRDIQRH
jgi:hypothetical protein